MTIYTACPDFTPKAGMAAVSVLPLYIQLEQKFIRNRRTTQLSFDSSPVYANQRLNKCRDRCAQLPLASRYHYRGDSCQPTVMNDGSELVHIGSAALSLPRLSTITVRTPGENS